MFETAKELTVTRWMAVAMPNERIFGLYLLSAFVLAVLTWLYYRYFAKHDKPEQTERGVLAYLFDKEVYLHRSALQDYIYFFINGAIYVGLISQLLLSTHFFMMMFYSGMEHLFGTGSAGALPFSFWVLVAYTITYALFLDFAIYITHLAQHKIPLLWEFHKVHHSAEVLTPITLYRMHPIDLFLSGIVASLLAGLAFAGFYYLTGETPQAYEVMGVNIIVFAFYLFGYNLRHTHVWLNYPPWLSHIFISPAQHQIHHSTAPKHFDKNMGLIFAFWDKLFGTLYVPRGYEKLSYGINKKKPNPFNTVRDMYFQPFKQAWKIINPGGKGAGTKTLVFAMIVFFCIANYTIFFALDRTIMAENRPLPSVHVEELTWTEVARALDQRDYDTIIIPTGGTEQNGPHMITGKHNYIVRHNAGEIAKRLGGTLVAPVISYVPEDVHMPYPGTVSVPEEIFAGLLKAAAESYIAHGFQNILFIGDSHGNQDAQEKIAAALNGKDGATVAHIGDYYSANGQMAYLQQEKGYEKNTIGGHAGIRDTSEMMVIYPDGIRKNPWLVEGRDTGHNGNPLLASKKIGQKMIDLKIEAALQQIRTVLGREKKATTNSAIDQALPAQPYR